MQQENYKILSFLNKIADMVILSALWCICSLPVVTAGASTSALYHTVVRSVREDRAYAAPSFWKEFKRDLKQSTVFCIGALVITLAFAATAYEMYHFLGNFAANVVFVFSCICICVGLTVQIHAYFLIGRFEIRGRAFVSALLKMSGGGVVSNILTFLVLLFAVEVIIWYPVFLLIVPAGFVFVISFMEEKRFRKYIRWNEEEEQGKA